MDLALHLSFLQRIWHLLFDLLRSSASWCLLGAALKRHQSRLVANLCAILFEEPGKHSKHQVYATEATSREIDMQSVALFYSIWVRRRRSSLLTRRSQRTRIDLEWKFILRSRFRAFLQSFLTQVFLKDNRCASNLMRSCERNHFSKIHPACSTTGK